jgi:hypothetical protein
MTDLPFRHINRLLSAVNTLYSDINPATLRERTLKAISCIIPAEIIQFNGFTLDGSYSGISWGTMTILPSRMQVLASLIHEHPFFNDFTCRGSSEALKISDFLSLPEFHKTRIYKPHPPFQIG